MDGCINGWGWWVGVYMDGDGGWVNGGGKLDVK